MATAFQVLQKKIDEQKELLEQALFANRAVTIEDYRHMTGQLRGLTVAANLAKDLEKQLQEQDWEE